MSDPLSPMRPLFWIACVAIVSCCALAVDKVATHMAPVDGAGCLLPEGATVGEVDAFMARVGKKRAGRELDGRLHDEYPRELTPA